MIESLKPDSVYVYFYKGLVQTKYRKFQQAYQSLRKSEVLDPVNPETIINLATVHYFMGRLDSAIATLVRARELEPKNANAYNLQSLIALERTDYQTALVEINRALDEVPGEPYFLNNRGYVYLEMDSLELALDDINRSIVLNPENGWAYRNKGIYLFRKGDYSLSVKQFERALDTGDFIDEVYYYLGMAHHMQKNTEEACNAWRTGAALKEERSERMKNQNCR